MLYTTRKMIKLSVREFVSVDIAEQSIAENVSRSTQLRFIAGSPSNDRAVLTEIREFDSVYALVVYPIVKLTNAIEQDFCRLSPGSFVRISNKNLNCIENSFRCRIERNKSA